ncbi:MAG: hypothetical protein R2831_04270 [Chitinophagaceae bacterium]
MKTRILTSLFLLISFFALAQNTTLPKSVQKDIAVLQKADIGLSDIQLQRITLVLTQENDMIDKNKEAAKGNPEVLKERLKLLHENKIRNIKGAMTPLQVQKFDELKLADKL